MSCRRAGRKQLGGRVQGTRTWVGTTEAAALLRSFGLRARIVDFLGSRPATGCPPPAGALFNSPYAVATRFPFCWQALTTNLPQHKVCS